MRSSTKKLGGGHILLHTLLYGSEHTGGAAHQLAEREEGREGGGDVREEGREVSRELGLGLGLWCQ